MAFSGATSTNSCFIGLSGHFSGYDQHGRSFYSLQELRRCNRSTEVTNLLMIWQVVFLVTDLIAVIWGFELAALDSKVATLLKIASFLIERIDRNHLISSAIKANAFGGSPMPVSCQSVM
jgi:hypothetical protein